MNSHFDLEDRFTEPEGWVWNFFERNGRRIRFGYIAPDNPKAIIVALPGLSEFGEKYFEFARDVIARGYGFYVIDWFGQGASGRYLKNPLKRHAADFKEDVADLNAMIFEHVSHDIPLHMLAHSMGGNIGLRYLLGHPDTFKSASFSAPMVGIHALHDWPRWFGLGLSAGLRSIMGQTHTSFHGKHGQHQRTHFNGNPLTTDPVRFPIMQQWMDAHAVLNVGDVTFGWVYYALRSCFIVQDHAAQIETPCLFGLGSEDSIISNDAIRDAVLRISNSTLVEVQGARHELLIEKDALRVQFTDAFFAHVEACNTIDKQAH